MTNEISESGADAESSETKEIVATLEVATSPRPFTIYWPIRKRAFHRALKRKEGWAIMQKLLTDTTGILSKSFYANLGRANPFDSIMGLEKQFEDKE